MPSPRVFVSSTAYDFGLLRGQLRSFIAELGFEAVLSEFADVLYDPRTHTHNSCVKEVPGCDLLIVIIGSRFGSEATARAVKDIDFETIAFLSSDTALLENEDIKVSVTQLEVLKAIEQGVPVFAFVDERVLGDHATYEANRDNEIIETMRFGSISQPGTARYIFEFINLLRGRVANNAIFGFSKIEDIESQLRKQWAALFQRLLDEERNKLSERQRIDRLAEQFEDLKTAILATIGDAASRDVARGVVKFRYLMDVLRAFDIPNLRQQIEDSAPWDALMRSVDVDWDTGIEVVPDPNGRGPDRLRIERVVGNPLISRMSASRLKRVPNEWAQFIGMAPSARLAVFDALEPEISRMPLIEEIKPQLIPKEEYQYEEEPF